MISKKNFVLSNTIIASSNISLTKLERILIVIDFYNSRGCNKESVNNVYRKIINS